ncbi:MAG: nucleoside kinase [Bacilli bacterium]|nr:nucleoside kinase [Bacilli bacterium]
MIEKDLKVTVLGEEKQIAYGTPYIELVKEYQDQFKFPIIAVKHNGAFKELNDPIIDGGEVELHDLMTSAGNRIYLNGLTYVVIYAIKELYGKSTKVYVRFSIDKGLYIETNLTLTKEIVKEIKKKMQTLIDQDLSIASKNVSRVEAMDYFEKLGDSDKVDMLKYNTNSYITLYKLGSMYDFFFSIMPVSTGVLKYFDLVFINEKGFVLMYPDRYNEGEIGKYKHHPQRFEIFRMYQEWVKLMNIPNASALNKKVSQGNIGDLIRIDESVRTYRLIEIAKDIFEHRDRVKIILLAGPSSAGKTTTSLKLTNYLKIFGFNPIQISMDDYFVPRAKNPKKPDGSYDYECLEALDLDLLDSNVDKLLNGEEITAPVYNFLKGEPEFTKKLKLNKNDILVMEGIHGLNPAILKSIPRSKKYKIYISPLTALTIDNHNRISTSDNRLLRRIIRDNRTRGYKVEDTLKSWQNVREGEEKYIFPHQDEANVIFNTSLNYELGVLKTFVEPLLYSVDYNSEYYTEAKRLLNLLKTFLPISSEDIPDDSILREFIGGSCFNVN